MCCLLFTIGCCLLLLFLLFGDCCLLLFVCLLFVSCCSLMVVCGLRFLGVCRWLRVVRCLSWFVCCVCFDVAVVCCLLSVG